MRDVFDHYDVIAKQLPHVAWHFLDIIAINARICCSVGGCSRWSIPTIAT